MACPWNAAGAYVWRCSDSQQCERRTIADHHTGGGDRALAAGIKPVVALMPLHLQAQLHDLCCLIIDVHHASALATYVIVDRYGAQVAR